MAKKYGDEPLLAVMIFKGHFGRDSSLKWPKNTERILQYYVSYFRAILGAIPALKSGKKILMKNFKLTQLVIQNRINSNNVHAGLDIYPSIKI